MLVFSFNLYLNEVCIKIAETRQQSHFNEIKRFFVDDDESKCKKSFRNLHILIKHEKKMHKIKILTMCIYFAEKIFFQKML